MNSKDIIKSLRNAGMTQSEISRLSGIPQPTISRAENGIHETCNEKTFSALLAVFKQQTATA